MIPPWVKLISIAAAMVTVVVCIYGYGKEQFGLGEKAERSAWQERENAALTAANTRIATLEEQARISERDHAQAMADTSAQYQKELSDERATKDRVIADLRRGALRLRIPTTDHAAGGSSAAAHGTASLGGDGEARCELSVSASEFLVGLANEADEIVRQLAACQAVIAADRKLQGEQ